MLAGVILSIVRGFTRTFSHAGYRHELQHCDKMHSLLSRSVVPEDPSIDHHVSESPPPEVNCSETKSRQRYQEIHTTVFPTVLALRAIYLVFFFVLSFSNMKWNINSPLHQRSITFSLKSSSG